MAKRLAAALLFLAGSLVSAGVSVIVPYEDEAEKPAVKKELSPEEQKQEAAFRERIRQRDAARLEQQKAHDAFVREQREKHEAEVQRQKAAQQEDSPARPVAGP